MTNGNERALGFVVLIGALVVPGSQFGCEPASRDRPSSPQSRPAQKAAPAPDSALDRTWHPSRQEALNHLPDIVRREIVQAEESAARSPDSAASVGRLGVLYYAYDLSLPAVDCFDRATRLQPGAIRWWYYWGLAHEKAARPAEATDAYRQAIRVEPSYAPAHIRLANLTLEDDVETARSFFEQAVRLAPTNAEAHYGLGRCALRAEDSETAMRRFRTALEHAPDYKDAHYAVAMLLLAAGKRDQAQVHLEGHASGINPPIANDPLRLELLRTARSSDALVADALHIAGQGRLDDALLLMERAAEVDPSGTYVRNAIGVLLAQHRRFDEAAEHFRLALRNDPSDFQAESSLGQCLAETGDLAGAESLYRKVLERNPNDAPTLERLGMLLLRKGHADSAIRLLRRHIQVRPGRALGHIQLASALAWSRRFDEAAAEARSAAKLQSMTGRTVPGIVGHLDALMGDRQSASRPAAQPQFGAHDLVPLARFLSQAGLAQDAADALMLAARRDNTIVSAYRTLADLARSAGRSKAARQFLEQGLAANPLEIDLMRDLAWMLATDSSEAIRDGPRARDLANAICGQTLRRDAKDLELLAAATAERGDFDLAIQIVQEAKALDPPADLNVELDRCIEYFQAKRPIRIAAPRTTRPGETGGGTSTGATTTKKNG